MDQNWESSWRSFSSCWDNVSSSVLPFCCIDDAGLKWEEKDWRMPWETFCQRWVRLERDSLLPKKISDQVTSFGPLTPPLCSSSPSPSSGSLSDVEEDGINETSRPWCDDEDGNRPFETGLIPSALYLRKSEALSSNIHSPSLPDSNCTSSTCRFGGRFPNIIDKKDPPPAPDEGAEGGLRWKSRREL